MRGIPVLQALIGVCVVVATWAQPTFSQDWSRDAVVPDGGRPNPYGLSVHEFERARWSGKIHALNYPVGPTGILLPYHPIKNIIEGTSDNLLKKFISGILGVVAPFQSFDEMAAWLGLAKYPTARDAGLFEIPDPLPNLPEHRMGLTFRETPHGLAFTMSCAQCHVDTLFGKPIIGMSNRFPRANDFFKRGIDVTPQVGEGMFRWATNATRGETELFREIKHTVGFIAAKAPVQLGLDTSLAQVALSLAKREADEYASLIPQRRARRDFLETHVADSKPAVWWNLKYKNRWLSDGSVVSGNPIFTNIIWNEIGRGADLREIEEWLYQNSEIIKELTTVVFSTEAPHITDFFPAERINEMEAREGERLFNRACAKCHGVYFKNWSRADAGVLSAAERLKTYFVRYPEQTSVVDVGTDPGRHQGMRSLVQLNRLSVSQSNGIVIEPQKGYVPPPLVGIWARWPYFHNNSVPSLCAVLTAGERRPKQYWARAAVNPSKDFDFECNGYPVSRVIAALPRENYYDTRRKGMSNRGHDEGIFVSQGRETFSPEQKKQLIQFLQTL